MRASRSCLTRLFVHCIGWVNGLFINGRYLQAIRSRLLASGVPAGVVDNTLAQAGNPFANTAVTTIYEIRPQRMLEGGGPGGLLFDPVAMKRQRGFAEAKAFFEALAPAPVQDPTV